MRLLASYPVWQTVLLKKGIVLLLTRRFYPSYFTTPGIAGLITFYGKNDHHAEASSRNEP